VGADGKIFLNFIGAVHVAGLTIETGADDHRKGSGCRGDFSRNRRFRYSAKEYATQGVSVLGEVQRSRACIPCWGVTNVIRCSVAAGGTTPKAGRSREYYAS